MGIPVWLLLTKGIGTLSARVNILTSANVKVTCTGYNNLSVKATNLTPGQPYVIEWTFKKQCDGNSPVTIFPTSSFSFTATSDTETVTLGSGSGMFQPAVMGNCTVTGSATITSSGSTVSICVSVDGVNCNTNGVALNCPSSPLTLACAPASTGQVGVPYNSCLVASGGTPPYTSFALISGELPPGLSFDTTTGCITGTPTEAGTFPSEFEVTDSAGGTANTAGSNCIITVTPSMPCVIPPSGTAIPGAPVSWNSFKAPAGSVVWTHAHISGPGNVQTNTITTVNFTGVSLVVNTTTYALPNGTIVFNPAISTPTTVVNADGSWTTTVNPNQSGDIFFVGQAIPVDSNLENGGKSTFSFTTNSSDSALTFSWQWSAAVYTCWPGNAAANIEPVHASLQAGAPQNTAVQKCLIQGPRGGGGSNFTGSWSGTGHGTCLQH